MKIKLAKTFLVQTLIVSHLVSSIVYAQGSAVTAAPQSQSNVTQVKAEEKASSPFHLDLGIEYSQKVASDQEGVRESGTDFTLGPSYKVNSLLKVSAKTVFTKENTGARQTSVSNTQLGFSVKGIKINEELKTTHKLTGTIPTNEDSQKRDHLQGAAALTNGLAYETTFAKVNYALALTRNFHEFNINAEGSPNIQYRIANLLDVTIPITEKLSLSAGGTYRYGRTYGGFERTAFSVDADINFDITDKLTINLGTSNDGNALKSNGSDSNISAYDENSSVTRLGLSLAL